MFLHFLILLHLLRHQLRSNNIVHSSPPLLQIHRPSSSEHCCSLHPPVTNPPSVYFPHCYIRHFPSKSETLSHLLPREFPCHWNYLHFHRYSQPHSTNWTDWDCCSGAFPRGATWPGGWRTRPEEKRTNNKFIVLRFTMKTRLLPVSSPRADLSCWPTVPWQKHPDSGSVQTPSPSYRSARS